jgi:hypothetical protein
MTTALEKSDRILGNLFSRLTPSSPSKVTHDAPNSYFQTCVARYAALSLQLSNIRAAAVVERSVAVT